MKLNFLGQENPLHHHHRVVDREKRLQLLRSSTLRYDNDLPIVQRRDEIAEMIRKNQVIVLCGETGSGKSTQIPKICLELGRGITGTIGHTQPRRIAARIAEELGNPLGQTVGYNREGFSLCSACLILDFQGKRCRRAKRKPRLDGSGSRWLLAFEPSGQRGYIDCKAGNGNRWMSKSLNGVWRLRE